MTKYNKTYIHKFTILHNEFFTYLNILYLQEINIHQYLFHDYASSKRLNKIDKSNWIKHTL